MQSSRSISSSARGKQEEHQHQGRVRRQGISLGRKKGELGENRGAVRLDGELLVKEAEQLMRRGGEPEEEADLDWVRRRMEEVQMSSSGEIVRTGRNQGETVMSRRKPGESVRAVGNRGRNAKVPGSELSAGVLRGEGRRNSEPTSQVEGKGLARAVGNLGLSF